MLVVVLLAFAMDVRRKRMTMSIGQKWVPALIDNLGRMSTVEHWAVRSIVLRAVQYITSLPAGMNMCKR